jgi:hypothetical protein
MDNRELINQLKYRSDFFEKEDIINIIETASKVYFEKQPFADEEEFALNTLNKLIEQFSNLDRKYIQKAKEKIIKIIC